MPPKTPRFRAKDLSEDEAASHLQGMWRARQARSQILAGEESPWSGAWEILRLDLLDRGVSTRASDSLRAQAKAVLAQRPEVDADALAELAERAENARYARPGTDETAGAAADDLRRQVLASVDREASFVDRIRRTLFPASASG